MKSLISIFTFTLLAAASTQVEDYEFDIAEDVAGYIEDANGRIEASRNSSLSYVDKQQKHVIDMITQVSNQMQTTSAQLRDSMNQFISQYSSATSNKTRAARIQSVFGQYLTAAQKAVDDIRTKSLTLGIRKTPEAISEDLRAQVDNITQIALADAGKYSINRDFYNCRYMYHTRLISDYFLFASKNNAYCVDFLNYQIFGDSAELLQLIFHSYDQQIDLLEEALRAKDLEPVLARVDVKATWLYDRLYNISVRWEKKQRMFGVRKCVEATNYTFIALLNIIRRDYDVQPCRG